MRDNEVAIRALQGRIDFLKSENDYLLSMWIDERPELKDENVRLRARVDELVRAALDVVNGVDLPPAGDYYHDAKADMLMERLRAVVGGRG